MLGDFRPSHKCLSPTKASTTIVAPSFCVLRVGVEDAWQRLIRELDSLRSGLATFKHHLRRSWPVHQHYSSLVSVSCFNSS